MAGKRATRQSELAILSPDGSFWDHPDVTEALLGQDFGSLLRCYRLSFSPPISQLELANALDLTQGHVSRIESGKVVIKSLDKLSRWSRLLGLPESRLWFSFAPGDVSTETTSKESSRPVGGGTSDRRDEAPAVRSSDYPASPPINRSTGSTRPPHLIGSDDVSVLRATIDSFRQLDNRFGGGHLRSSVAVYLANEVDPNLQLGRFHRGARREYQRASVELNQLVGWMAYDVGDDTVGRRYLRRALEISSEAGDDALAAEMLAAMSHQAAYAGRAEEAIDFALEANRSSVRSGTPALQAESALLEAQGYALQKDVHQCLARLRRAEKAFNLTPGPNTPSWLRYFDHAYMSAKFAHALRGLGSLKDAEKFARNSLQMCDGYDRGRLFNTALLASILADERKFDEAASCAQDAAGMASQIRSARAWRYLDDVRTQLYPHRKSSSIASMWPNIIAAQRRGSI